MLSFRSKRMLKLKDDTFVYMLAKTPGVTQFFPPNKLSYYTQPYRKMNSKDVRNSLIGFIDETTCRTVQSSFSKTDKLCSIIEMKEPLNDLDNVKSPFVFDDVYVYCKKLEDVKTLANAMGMPLIIVANKHHDGTYNIFYHKPERC